MDYGITRKARRFNGKHASDLLKGRPIYSPKYFSTRKGRPFGDYLKLVRADKRSLNSAYRGIK